MAKWASILAPLGIEREVSSGRVSSKPGISNANVPRRTSRVEISCNEEQCQWLTTYEHASLSEMSTASPTLSNIQFPATLCPHLVALKRAVPSLVMLSARRPEKERFR